MSLCQIGLFKNFLCCSWFLFDIHTICNLFQIENMIFMNIFWRFIFQPKCFVYLPVPPTFRFVHVLPAGTRGVSHMVRHCDWSVRLDRGMADWGLLYLSRRQITHQSPKSKKKNQVLCFNQYLLNFVGLNYEKKWLWAAVSNNKLY